MFDMLKEKLAENSRLLEESLSSYFGGTELPYGELVESQRYSLLGGGKRIRAFLVMQFARAFGADERAALPYASAIEMVHAYSLVHDDLPCMDNDDERRGKPSNHKVYGEAMALLAGDALLTKAFWTVATNSYTTPEANAKAVEILSRAAGTDGMIGGQTLDIKAENEALELDGLLLLHSLKTGMLITGAAMLGCAAAGIFEGEKLDAAVSYAKGIGLAFQIVDDILDYEEGERKINSFMSFMSVDEAKKYALDISEKAIKSIEKYDIDGTLCELARYLCERKQ